MFLKALIIALFKSASEILDFASSKVNFIFLLNESYKLPAKSLQMNNFMRKTSKNFYKETCSRKSNRERALWNEAKLVSGLDEGWLSFLKINLLRSNISLLPLSLFAQLQKMRTSGVSGWKLLGDKFILGLESLLSHHETFFWNFFLNLKFSCSGYKKKMHLYISIIFFKFEL